MFRLFLLITTFLFCVTTKAQQVEKLRELKTSEIREATVDRLGNLFLTFSNGSIIKYNPDGRAVAKLNTKKLPTLLEPWFHPKIFAYFGEEQRIVNYNHIFEISDDFKLDASIAVEPSLVCPTNDNKYLVLDKADLSIKKFNPYDNRILNDFFIDSTQLQPHPHFVFMREYLHLIFLLDQNHELVIVNDVGKIIKRISLNIQNFGFFGEELFYLQGDKIIFFDLYSEKTNELKLVSGQFGIVTDERIFIINKKKVTIYKFIPYKPDDKG